MTASKEFFKDALLKILNLPEKIDKMLSTSYHSSRKFNIFNNTEHIRKTIIKDVFLKLLS